jgi:hypothetical protein
MFSFDKLIHCNRGASTFAVKGKAFRLSIAHYYYLMPYLNFHFLRASLSVSYSDPSHTIAIGAVTWELPSHSYQTGHGFVARTIVLLSTPWQAT